MLLQEEKAQYLLKTKLKNWILVEKLQAINLG